MTTMTEELMRRLEKLVDDGAGIDEVLEILDAEGVDPAAIIDDGSGRPQVTTDHPRGYWNIRDAAAGDAKRARDIAESIAAKHGRAENALAELQSWVDEQVARIKYIAEKQAAAHRRRAAWCEGVLDEYVDDFGGGASSVPLVNGTPTRQKNRPVLTRDTDAAFTWALQQPDVDELAPRYLSVSAVNAQLEKRPDGSYVHKSTGEIVPWQRQVPNPVPYRFVVKH